VEVTYNHVETGTEGGALAEVTGGVAVERVKKTRNAV
jgi:hypothetical protein